MHLEAAAKRGHGLGDFWSVREEAHEPTLKLRGGLWTRQFP